MKVSIGNLTLDARSLSANADQELIPYIARYCGLGPEEIISYKIERRSVDARSKPDVRVLYSLTVELADSARPDIRLEAAPMEMPFEEPHYSFSEVPLHPVIVGAGPAGLFCGLVLAMAGCKPVILDRGRDVERRKEDIDRFYEERELNEESNLLFGEGGAGAWSDGKLFTRIRDPRISFVLNEMIKAGAPEAIRYYSHPHIGSDLLPDVIAELRKKIIDLGGEFRWETCAEDLLVKDDSCQGVILSNGEKLEAPLVITATGHSAREFILAMTEAGAAYRMKGFQIGCRIEHPQEFINWCQYGSQETIPLLGNAEYNMVSRPDFHTDGATSFCMCPGGEVIPATPKRERLCTNGMSDSGRRGPFANAAIVTNISEKTFRSPAEAFAFLDSVEKKAYEEGGGDYACPAQRAKDFLMGRTGTLPKHTSWWFGLKPARVDQLLPQNAMRSIARALIHFDHNAPGYIKYGTILGTETRISSPVRFERDELTRESPTLQNLYPAGEGAGLAGGITSSAIDGILTAEAVLKKHAR